FSSIHSFFLLLRRPRTSPLFPYTTLFRSARLSILSAVHSVPWDRESPRCEPNGPRRSSGASDISRDRRTNNEPRSPVRRRLKSTDRKSTRLNSSHDQISYAVFCLKKKNKQ